jgi:hypothetical protein
MAERIRGPRAVIGPRQSLVARGTARLDTALADYFAGLMRRVLRAAPGRKGHGGIAVKAEPSAGWVDDFDWDEEERTLRGVLTRFYDTMGPEVFGVINAQVNADIRWDLSERGVRRIMGRVANRVTRINETSKDAIRSVVERNIREEANADVMERELRDLLRSWGESGGRAHVIALTESANAFNQAAIEGYRETGLVDSVEVYDGPDCGWTEHDDPDLADGSIRSLTEAEMYPEAHPHCQRAFGPVISRE